MAKKYKVTLTVDERETLKAVIDRGKHKSQKVKRAHILLKADEGEHGEHWKDKQIAKACYVRVRTVEKTRERFVKEGFEITLLGKPYPERAPFKITGEVEAHLITLRCSKPPEGYEKWTLRLLADKMVELNYVESLSHESVRRTLKKRLKTLASEKLVYTEAVGKFRMLYGGCS